MRARIDVIPSVHAGERPQIRGGPVGHQTVTGHDHVVLDPTLHNLHENLARARSRVGGHPVKARTLGHEGPVGVHGGAHVGPGFEG